MFLIKMVGKLDPNGPLADDEEFAGIGGAYVNVWLDFADFEGARVLARFYTERAGWMNVEEQEAWEMEEDQVSDEDQPLYEEAAEYGYTTASYMWPKDVPDANGNFENKGS